ncbi:helix-turn-helix domain-containing protein [Enterobacter sp. RHB15-C17]|uniref:transcriptional regulator n=1 Tax=Lelliottia aquatilis TaxID=2080838 RepID=UPI000CDE7E2B|nr:YdaS family helix-turn-helix protein [Lelliottia aquatilis]POZ15043.1 Rha family transcriptional regulator [Lelliottia aquatilis]QMM52593.1 helix-turn-helix domain-containing protein [Enterobacter sp. RHB15-C17]
MTGIENAILRSGSASALGALIGVSKMAVSLWRRNGIPAERVLPIFTATGVTPHELRPDLYPNPTDGLPK